MRSYQVSRTIFSIQKFLAWAIVIGGLLLAFGGASVPAGFGGRSAGFIGALPGIIMLVSGVFLARNVQSGRASVDSAEYSQQMLKLARDQIELSKQGLKQGATVQQGFAAEPFTEKPTPSTSFANQTRSTSQSNDAAVSQSRFSSGGETIDYRGHKIARDRAQYWVGNTAFHKLGYAKDFINTSRVSINHIFLRAFDKWLNVGGRDKPHIMAQFT